MCIPSVKLVDPTDFEILECLQEHDRNVAVNLSAHLDRDRAYLNARMPHLLDFDLVDRIGPSESSGLYEITDRGRAVLKHSEEYGELGSREFEELVKQQL